MIHLTVQRITSKKKAADVTAERMVKLTYDSQKVCVERDASVKPYITSSVTLILHPDVNLDKLKQTCK